MNDARRKLVATFISALGIAGVGVHGFEEGSTGRLDSSAETNQIAAEETAIGGMTIANPFSTAIAAAAAFDAMTKITKGRGDALLKSIEHHRPHGAGRLRREAHR